MGECDWLEDAYKFRTLMLRNVALRAPCGHNGAQETLTDMFRQHVDPKAMFAAFTLAKATLPEVPWLQHTDFLLWQDSAEMLRQ